MVAPANDNFADATVITLTGGAYTSGAVVNTDATLESFEGVGQPFQSMGWSCWWTWTPDADVTVQIDTMQSTGAADVDTRLWVYAGTDTTDMVLVAANDDGGYVEPNLDYPALLTLDATAATVYWIRVDGYSNDITYVLHIAVDSIETPVVPIEDGRTRGGSGVDLSIYPVIAVPASIGTPEAVRITAIQLPNPTLVNGRPL